MKPILIHCTEFFEMIKVYPIVVTFEYATEEEHAKVYLIHAVTQNDKEMAEKMIKRFFNTPHLLTEAKEILDMVKTSDIDYNSFLMELLEYNIKHLNIQMVAKSLERLNNVERMSVFRTLTARREKKTKFFLRLLLSYFRPQGPIAELLVKLVIVSKENDVELDMIRILCNSLHEISSLFITALWFASCLTFQRKVSKLLLRRLIEVQGTNVTPLLLENTFSNKGIDDLHDIHEEIKEEAKEKITKLVPYILDYLYRPGNLGYIRIARETKIGKKNRP